MHTLSKPLGKYLMLLCVLYTHCTQDNLFGNTVEQGIFCSKIFVESQSVVVLNFCKLSGVASKHSCTHQQIMQKCVSVETTHSSHSRVYCTGFIPLASSCTLSTHLLAGRTAAGWTKEDSGPSGFVTVLVDSF